ncbi:DUF3566 domain-containing protein [Georgenia sp. MJ170]|uniref:DUF3566 domain-containing protein n=1 Tax=Georgenia sunbinii TaxID=3117728 RepID=UPI002F26AD6E
MSSSTPEGPSAPSPAAGGPDEAGAAERTAIRTSLAQRFAAAKAEPSLSAPDSPSSPVDETMATPRTAQHPPVQGDATGATGAAPTGPAAPTAGPVASPPAATAPRFGATATSSTARAATGATRLGEDPGPAAQARAANQPPTAGRPTGARKVRLSLARVDPWSVMKLSFLMSIAIGIGIMIAAAAMWFLLDSMQVFADIRELLVTLGSPDFLQLMEYAEFDRVISMAAIIAVVDILLLTALATLAAFLYNIVAALVGGVHLTLTDD